jgi:hypothetical protein
MAKDLSIQAVLVARTTPFEQGMKQASNAAKKFSADMKRIRQEINQPLFVPKPGGKQTPEMVMFGGSITQGLAAEKFRQIQRSERLAMVARKDAIEHERKQHNDRFQMIRQSEEKALKLRQFYARKEAELEAARGGFRLPGGAIKKAFGAAGLAAGMIGESFGGTTAGRIGSAIGNIGGAAAMGGMVGGPWGAAVFGGVAALKEFKQAVEDANKSLRNAIEWRDKEEMLAKERQKEITQEVRGRAIAFLHPERPETLESVQEDLRVRAGQLRRDRDRRSVMDPEREKISKQLDDLRNLRASMGNLIGTRDISQQIGQFIGNRMGLLSSAAVAGGDRFGGIAGGVMGRGAAENERIALAREALMGRVQSLMGMSSGPMGAPLAIRGTNEYLRAISDQPQKNMEQNLEELVDIAEQQLEEEKKTKTAIEKLVIDRITVNM